MKALWLTVLLLGCAKADGRPAPPARPVLTFTAAAGDTARGFFSYTAGARATGAVVTLRVTSFPATATWTGLPVALPSPAGGKVTFVATSAAADSADFAPCVIWTNAAGSSAELCGTARRWRRVPGTGTITWDSLLSVLLFPESLTVTLVDAGRVVQPGVWDAAANRWTTPPLNDANGAAITTPQTDSTIPGLFGPLFRSAVVGRYVPRLQFCPFAKFAGDTVTLPAQFAAVHPCDYFYADSLAAGIWHRPRAGQQLAANDLCWTFTADGGSWPVATGVWQAPPTGGRYRISLIAASCSPALKRAPTQYVEHHLRVADGEIRWLQFPGERLWVSQPRPVRVTPARALERVASR